jgi:outer membrane protein assembly factor BamB
VALIGSALIALPFGVPSRWFGTEKPENGLGPNVETVLGNPARTGEVAGPAPQTSPAIRWRVPIRTSGISPLYADGRLFAVEMGEGESSARVIALDAATGETLWQAPIGAALYAEIALGDGLLFTFTGLNSLVALSQSTGEVVWSYPSGGLVGSGSPVVEAGVVYIGSSDESVRAVDIATGQELWRSSIPHTTVNQPENDAFYLTADSFAVAGGTVFATGDGGILYALSAKDGSHLWSVQTQGNILGTPAVANGTVYVVAHRAGAEEPRHQDWLYELDARDGSVLREQSLPGVQNVAISDNTMFVVRAFDVAAEADVPALSAIDLATGEVKWETEINAVAYPVVAGNLVIVDGLESEGVYLYALDKETGTTVWKVYGVATSVPLVADGFVVVTTENDVIALAEAGSGTPAADAFSESLECIPPRDPVPTVLPSGAPAASLIENRANDGGRPEILASELPTGDAASAGTVAMIERTLLAMSICAGADDAESLLAGFVTDDFLRREQSQELYEQAGRVIVWPILGSDNESITSVTTTVLLPDGRVAVPMMTSANGGWFIIFKEVDGFWLIDEEYEIVSELGGRG